MEVFKNDRRQYYRDASVKCQTKQSGKTKNYAIIFTIPNGKINAKIVKNYLIKSLSKNYLINSFYQKQSNEKLSMWKNTR